MEHQYSSVIPGDLNDFRNGDLMHSGASVGINLMGDQNIALRNDSNNGEGN